MIKSIGQDAKVKQKDILVDIIKLIAKVITKLYKSCLSQSFKTSSPAKVGRVSRSNQETESTSEISAEGTIITKGNSLRQRGREEAGWSETVSNTAQSRAREGQCPAFPFLLPPLLAQGTACIGWPHAVQRSTGKGGNGSEHKFRQAAAPGTWVWALLFNLQQFSWVGYTFFLFYM